MPRRTQREKPENTAARPLLFDERAVSSRALRIESVDRVGVHDDGAGRCAQPT